MPRVWSCAAVVLAAVAGATVLGAGCRDAPAVFRCASPDACGAGGQCEATGFCSFADPGCQETGRRYGEYAGDGLSGTCVAPDAAPQDAGPTPDASPPWPFDGGWPDGLECGTEHSFCCPTGDPCGAGLACLAAICVPCGEETQLCCDGQCRAGLTCMFEACVCPTPGTGC